jgi:hypothetical protein
MAPAPPRADPSPHAQAQTIHSSRRGRDPGTSTFGSSAGLGWPVRAIFGDLTEMTRPWDPDDVHAGQTALSMVEQGNAEAAHRGLPQVGGGDVHQAEGAHRGMGAYAKYLVAIEGWRVATRYEIPGSSWRRRAGGPPAAACRGTRTRLRTKGATS